MAKQHIAFISQSVKHDAQLAKWLYLMGVEPKEFDTHLHCPEHKNIDKQVPAYHRYAHHLRKVMMRLVDDDVQGFIKTPSEPHDNAISGYLVRTTDQKKNIHLIQRCRQHQRIKRRKPPARRYSARKYPPGTRR